MIYNTGIDNSQHTDNENQEEEYDNIMKQHKKYMMVINQLFQRQQEENDEPKDDSISLEEKDKNDNENKQTEKDENEDDDIQN